MMIVVVTGGACFVGGGTRLKILGAGLTVRPTLSTPVGACAYDVQHCRDIVLFNSSEEFIGRYKDVNNREKSEPLSQSLMNVAAAKFTGEEFEQSFHQVLR
jgi:hypothetical protein